MQTSALGFGCVAMTAYQTEQDALRILQVAYECGITHFDVARLYGQGLAEGILGKFVKHHRDSITITTKFGLNPPQTFTQYKGLINIARQTLKKFTFLKSLLKKTQTNLVKSRAFSLIEAKQSLETSLRELNTDYIDLWLLHECLPEDASNPDLLDFLDQMIQAGKIIRYGVGTNYKNIQGVLDLQPCRHQVIQFEQSILQQNIQTLKNIDDKLVVTHSVFKEVNPILDAGLKYPKLTKQYSDQIGLDLFHKQEIVGLLLAYAGYVNNNGIVLFSSTKPENIYRNVEMLEKRNYSEQTFEIFFDFLSKVLLFEDESQCH
jgi:D-threo-aldose 1-dehydrogenase